MTPRDDLPALSTRLAARAAELAETLTGAAPTQRGRTTWRFRARGSLAVEVEGPRRGLWHDHEAGQGGDALALIAHLRRMPLAEAIRWARGWLGEGVRASDTPKRRNPVQRPPGPPREASDTLPLARRMWREGQPVPGTIVETYLAARGLQWEAGLPLRFHPTCPRGAERLPAMLALMSDPSTGEPCGLHRTFIAADGRDRLRDSKGKAMLGNAGVIRLSRDEDVTAGLGIAEGIETALAVVQMFGWRPVWAATSAGMLARFPVLPGVESLTVFADPDGAGLAAAETCAAHWAEAGREAFISTPPAGDFNDMIRRGKAA
jgi:hypothetical protein